MLENKVNYTQNKNPSLEPGIYPQRNIGVYAQKYTKAIVTEVKYLDKNGVPTSNSALADTERIYLAGPDGSILTTEKKKQKEFTREIVLGDSPIYEKKYEGPTKINDFTWKIEWRGITIFFEKKGNQMGIFSSSNELSVHYDILTGCPYTRDQFIQAADGRRYVLHGVKSLTGEEMINSQFLREYASGALTNLIQNEYKQKLKNHEKIQDIHPAYSVAFGDFSKDYERQRKIEETRRAEEDRLKLIDFRKRLAEKQKQKEFIQIPDKKIA